jgi:hypothetical protein
MACCGCNNGRCRAGGRRKRHLPGPPNLWCVGTRPPQRSCCDARATRTQARGAAALASPSRVRLSPGGGPCAQHSICMLFNDERIRHIVDGTRSKAVLIIGRSMPVGGTVDPLSSSLIYVRMDASLISTGHGAFALGVGESFVRLSRLRSRGRTRYRRPGHQSHARSPTLGLRPELRGKAVDGRPARGACDEDAVFQHAEPLDSAVDLAGVDRRSPSGSDPARYDRLHAEEGWA